MRTLNTLLNDKLAVFLFLVALMMIAITSCDPRKSVVIERYEDGAVKKTHEFGIKKTNRALLREMGFHRDGDTSYIGYLDGSNLDSTWRIWFENKQQLWEIHTFNDGERDGKQMRWYQNGNPRNLDFYYGEERDSIQIAWYKNGNKKLEGYWEDDEKVGKWTYWYQNGEKQKEGVIKGGWFEEKTSLSYWRPEFVPIKHGKWVYWNQQGNIEKEEWYDWGILRKQITY
ncbi:MAG: hypothetical protein K9I94_03215 [Bacteroidales bacterium]|nr:hypothetical protein [Bacteroidales bacterium]